jgi:hypothetical protein
MATISRVLSRVHGAARMPVAAGLRESSQREAEEQVMSRSER